MKKLLFIVLGLCLIGKIYATDYTAYSSCVLAWLLDETSGTYSDSSGHSNTGTLGGGTMGNAGKFGNEYTQGNQNTLAYASPSASINNLTKFSIVAWHCHGGWGVNDSILGKMFSGFGTYDYNGALFFQFATNAQAGYARGGGGVSTTVLDHIAVTYDDGGSRTPHIFKNGSEIGYDYSIAATGTALDDSGDSFIIGSVWRIGYCYGSQYDEVAIFNNYLLSSTEINDIMTNGLKPSGGGTTYYIGREIGTGIGKGVLR
jgi:hypothetical protein